VHAAVQLSLCGACSAEAEIKKNIVAAIKAVAERLNNRPAVCRKHYVHPAILEAYTSGVLSQVMTAVETDENPLGLNHAEQCVLNLLRRERRAAREDTKAA
jgi:DNA topoisomerase-1